MKPSPEKLLLLAALLCAAGAGGAAAEQYLPDFTLNSQRASNVNQLGSARVPEVPPPTDTGYYARYGAGAARVESRVTVVVDGAAGKADIVFPKPPGPERGAGYSAALFIRLEGEASPVLSWATVFCSGGRYLGYKGAELALPRGGAAEVSLREETLALGPLRVRLLQTHPWIAGGAPLDSLCAPGLPARLKGATVRALPAEADGLAFRYDKAANALSVNWSR